MRSYNIGFTKLEMKENVIYWISLAINELLYYVAAKVTGMCPFHLFTDWKIYKLKVNDFVIPGAAVWVERLTLHSIQVWIRWLQLTSMALVRIISGHDLWGMILPGVDRFPSGIHLMDYVS